MLIKEYADTFFPDHTLQNCSSCHKDFLRFYGDPYLDGAYNNPEYCSINHQIMFNDCKNTIVEKIFLLSQERVVVDSNDDLYNIFVFDSLMLDSKIYYDFFRVKVVDYFSLKDVNYEMLRNVAGEFYFLFCLLKGDEEKFLDFLECTSLGWVVHNLCMLHFRNLLTMVEAYSELDYFVPASLMFNLYDINPYPLLCPEDN